jgi:hypothetical protein
VIEFEKIFILDCEWLFASLGAHSSRAIETARELFLTDVKGSVDWRPPFE